MKTIDLKSLGLEEMTNLEMKETDGGLLLVILAICAVSFLATSCMNSQPVVPIDAQKPSGASQPDSTLVK